MNLDYSFPFPEWLLLLFSQVQIGHTNLADVNIFFKKFDTKIRLVTGLCRLGFIVDFLSHATIVGFMAGAATVVCLQQLKGILGLEHFTHGTDLISVMRSVFTQTHKVSLSLSPTYTVVNRMSHDTSGIYTRLFWWQKGSGHLHFVISVSWIIENI